MPPDAWEDGDGYERFVGRWSRAVAPRFLAWAEVPSGGRVADVGCGTGALAAALLAQGARSVVGLDLSRGFVQEAGRRVLDPRATFVVGDARALPEATASFDAAVSGLALNFVPDPSRAASEMGRVTRPGGVVAAYVWDYARGMEMLRHFWDAALEVDPERAAPLDEGRRFPLCGREPLEDLFRGARLQDVTAAAIHIEMAFQNFEDLWRPFLGGQGPGPSYVAGLDAETRDRLRRALRDRVARTDEAPITLGARAWAVKGRVPASAGRS